MATAMVTPMPMVTAVVKTISINGKRKPVLIPIIIVVVVVTYYMDLLMVAIKNSNLDVKNLPGGVRNLPAGAMELVAAAAWAAIMMKVNNIKMKMSWLPNILRDVLHLLLWWVVKRGKRFPNRKNHSFIHSFCHIDNLQLTYQFFIFLGCNFVCSLQIFCVLHAACCSLLALMHACRHACKHARACKKNPPFPLSFLFLPPPQRGGAKKRKKGKKRMIHE